jgi:hypothetical protein
VSIFAERRFAERRARSAGVAVIVSVILLVGACVASTFDAWWSPFARPAGAAVTSAKLEPTRPVERVLIVSIPHVGWADLVQAPAPNLQRLLGDAAIANMTARSGGGGLVSGYLTLGAGKRSRGTATPSDGMGFGVDDRFGDGTAGRAFARRTGSTPADGVVALGIVGLREENERQPGGSSVGALGTALRDAGFRTAVIGNSDGFAPDMELDRYRRYVVTGLMTERGTVDGGRVDRGLLEKDPDSPFGLRLDVDEVVDAFRAVWVPRSVVMVEGSDIIRAAASRLPAIPAQDAESYEAALRRTDQLVGRLLEDVDPRRDAVVVVSPNSSKLTGGLTVVGVRAPGVTSGLMRSSSTRRDGFVLLADVAPSVLELLGVPRPVSMNGRPFVIVPGSRTSAATIERLIDETDAALFRDRVLDPVTAIATLGAGIVALGSVLSWSARRRSGWRVLAQGGASWLLGFVAAVYVARWFPFHDSRVVWYYAFVVGVAGALGAMYRRLGRGDPTRSTMLGLGVVVALLIADLVTGARLQLSTAFGYTPTIGVRFAGIGNVAYAFLGASTVLLAGLVAHRLGGRRGACAAAGLMAAALVVDVAPMLGGDVGGVLSLTPAYLVTGLLLFGIPIRRRTVLGLGGAAVLLLVVAAAVDLARPARDRTHLGRLVTNARDRGISEITDVIVRKLERNLDTWTTSAWRTMLAIGVVFVAILLWKARPRLAALLAEVPELRASLAGFGVLTVLGYAFNDSGVAIPAVTLYVFVAALCGMAARSGSSPAVAGVGLGPPQRPLRAAVNTASVRAATPSH